MQHVHTVPQNDYDVASFSLCLVESEITMEENEI